MPVFKGVIQINTKRRKMETQTIQTLVKNTLEPETACCAQPAGASACCTPSSSKEENSGACCAQPSDGSACCDK
jgi:hypothetical protein